MGDAWVKDKLGEAGFQVLGRSAAQEDKRVKAEAQRWAHIFRAGGVKRF